MIYARGTLRLLGIGITAMILAGILVHLVHAPDDLRAWTGLLIVGSWLAYHTRTAR